MFDIKPGIVMICEAGTHSAISDAYLALPGYNMVVRADGQDTTDGLCRGLLIWAKEGVKAVRYESDLIKDMVECEGITVPWGLDGTLLTVLLGYRPHRYTGVYQTMAIVINFVNCFQVSRGRFLFVGTSTTVG